MQRHTYERDAPDPTQVETIKWPNTFMCRRLSLTKRDWLHGMSITGTSRPVLIQVFSHQ